MLLRNHSAACTWVSSPASAPRRRIAWILGIIAAYSKLASSRASLPNSKFRRALALFVERTAASAPATAARASSGLAQPPG